MAQSHIVPAAGLIPAGYFDWRNPDHPYFHNPPAHGTWLSPAGFRCHFFYLDGKPKYDWAMLVALGLPDCPENRVLLQALARAGRVVLFNSWVDARKAAGVAYQKHGSRIRRKT